MYEGIQMGSGAKWKGFLINDEMQKYFTITEEALVIYDFAPYPSEIPYI
jgi:hypothetical protein